MYSFINTLIGIKAAEREMAKYSNVEELRAAMHELHKKAIISSGKNILCFICAFLLAVLVNIVIH